MPDLSLPFRKWRALKHRLFNSVSHDGSDVLRFTGSTGSKGFFAVMNGVLGALHEVEQGRAAGVEFCFDDGLFADRTGDNWLDYHFDIEPMRPGSVSRGAVFEYRGIPLHFHMITRQSSREANHRLIQRCLRIRPGILASVEEMCARFGQAYTLGVHFRGTDKSAEATPVTYEDVIPAVDRQLAHIGDQDVRLYVATDEEGFVSFMRDRYGDAVLHQPGAVRAIDDRPVHKQRHPSRLPSELAREALIDALVLSRTHHLVRTSSNLSLWAGFFNPRLEVTRINQRFGPFGE